MEKKLYRSNKDKKLAGVCAGVADYIGLDPTVVRLLWVLLCFVGAGILAYIVAAIIMPEAPADTPANAPAEAPKATEPTQDQDKPEQL